MQADTTQRLIRTYAPMILALGILGIGSIVGVETSNDIVNDGSELAKGGSITAILYAALNAIGNSGKAGGGILGEIIMWGHNTKPNYEGPVEATGAHASGTVLDTDDPRPPAPTSHATTHVTAPYYEAPAEAFRAPQSADTRIYDVDWQDDAAWTENNPDDRP